MLRKDWMNGCTRPAWLMVLAALLLMASPDLFAAGSYVPPVVVTASSSVTATGLAWNEANVALDACGNIYCGDGCGDSADGME